MEQFRGKETRVFKEVVEDGKKLEKVWNYYIMEKDTWVLQTKVQNGDDYVICEQLALYVYCWDCSYI